MIEIPTKEYVDTKGNYFDFGNISNVPGEAEAKRLAYVLDNNKHKIAPGFFSGCCEDSTIYGFVGVYNPYQRGYFGLIVFSYFDGIKPYYLIINDGSYIGAYDLI